MKNIIKLLSLSALVILALYTQITFSTESNEFAKLKKECDSNDGLACTKLGLIYMTGNGVSQDYSTPINLFQKGCDLNEGIACGSLGNLYENVLNTNNLSKVHALYQKGCDLYDGISCTLLGSLYEQGKGVPKDLSTALNIYKKACNLNDGNACRTIANIYNSGKTIARDVQNAIYYYQRGCDLNNADSCFDLANIYIKLKHSNTAFNNDDTYTYHSFTLLKKGCDMNHGPSCGALGAIISLSNADLPAAKQLLKKDVI